MWLNVWVPILRGKLNGYIVKESEWSWCVPLKAPLGQYRIAMRVYNNALPMVIREKEDVINVVP